MSASVIVYGPAGCGKTRNAEKLRVALGCRRIIDEGSLPLGSVLNFPTSGVLVLTNDPSLGAPPTVRRIPFNHAMRIARLARKRAKADAT